MKRFSIVLLSAAALAVISCDSAGPDASDSSGMVVTSVRINADSDTLQGPGDAVQLEAVALSSEGEEITAGRVSWSSLDEAIATVDATGRLQAEDFGQAFIRAEIDGRAAQRAFLVADVLPQSSSASTVAFVGVNLVTMTSSSVQTDQTVIIRDGTISEIGSAATTSVPTEAVRIEATRAQPWFLMPGLVDLHIHMTGSSAEQDDVLKLYVANGVTTVREMWANGNSLRQRDRVELGALGPRIFAASPGMDGPGGPWAGSTPPVSDAEQARTLVRRYESEGYDFIKVYNLLEVDVYEAIMEEAAAVGIRVVGHVPQKVNLQTALDLGQYSMEHLLGFGALVSSTGTLNSGTLSAAIMAEWAEKVADSDTWNSPTLSVLIMSAERVQSIRRSNAYRYVPPSMKSFFETGFHQGVSSAASDAIDGNHKAMVRALRDAGAPMLLSTDAGFGYLIPGFSIHDELDHLVDAGMTPFEALAAGTSAAADFLGADNFGTVEIGKSADLMLVFGDPLEDVARAHRRLGVMVRGRWFSETRLRSMLEDIAKKYGN